MCIVGICALFTLWQLYVYTNAVIAVKLLTKGSRVKCKVRFHIRTTDTIIYKPTSLVIGSSWKFVLPPYKSPFEKRTVHYNATPWPMPSVFSIVKMYTCVCGTISTSNNSFIGLHVICIGISCTNSLYE